MISLSRIGNISIAVALLSGCALINNTPRPSNSLYVLKAENIPAAAITLPINVRIARPEAASGLDSERIAVLDNADELTYYTGAQWAQGLPQMLQGFMVDALGQSHQFKSVSGDRETILADVLISIHLHDYEVEGNALNPTVRIRLTANITHADSHKLISSVAIDKSVTANANHMADIVAAFNLASIQAALMISEEVKDSCAQSSCALDTRP